MTNPDAFVSQYQAIRAEGQGILEVLEATDISQVFMDGQSEMVELGNFEGIQSPLKISSIHLAKPEVKLATVLSSAKNFSMRVMTLINQPAFAKARHDLSSDLGGVATATPLCELYAQTNNQTGFLEAFDILRTSLRTTIQLLDGVSAYSSPDTMEVDVYSLDKFTALVTEVVGSIGKTIFPDQQGQSHFMIQANSLERNYISANAGVVINFLRNAIHNAKKHGEATQCQVRLAVADGDLVMSVLDNGQGIDESKISIDDIFTEGKSTGSTGLGLAKVPELLARFKASVEVTAQNTDDQFFPGAKFEVRLPLVRK